MGVSIRFHSKTLDCGYFGFKKLRDSILNHVPHKKLHEVYDDVQNNLFIFDADEKKKFYEDVNKKINDMEYLANEGSTKEEKIFLNLFCNFFWASDCEAKMKPAHAKAIWHYIENATEDFRFGYSARPDCSTFQQFKQCIKECVEKNKGFYWF